MKTHHKLPFEFDRLSLYGDLEKAQNQWIAHFNSSYFRGEWSGIQLREPQKITHGLSPGTGSDNLYQDTEILLSLDYIPYVLNSFKCQKTSVRLLKLTAGSIIKAHKDTDLNFFEGDLRIHIPIITNEKVEFLIDGELVRMAPGECWYADFSKEHSVKNLGETDRIHLVIDLKTNDWLKELFVDEGIIGQNEQAPDPISQFDERQKLEMIHSLFSHKTETSNKIAMEMIQKYGLTDKIDVNDI